MILCTYTNFKLLYSDKLEGSRLRYPCGHTACEHCVSYTEECQICTSPSQRSDIEPKADSPLTLSVKNATDLLKASQKLFNVNGMIFALLVIICRFLINVLNYILYVYT